MTTDNELQQAQADLRRLSRMLGTLEIAKDLVDTYGMETVGEALAMVEAAELQEDADKEPILSPTLKTAFANTRQARGRENIKIGQNRTPIGMNGKSVTKTSSFKDIADAPVRAFNKIANEDEMPRITAKGRPISSSALKAVKKAILGQRDERRSIEEGQAISINSIAEGILRRKALKEIVTPAAKTLVTHALPKEPSVRDQLPRAWTNSGLLPAERDIDVIDRLPNEFRPAADYLDIKGKFKTPAARTIERPSKIDFKDQEAFVELPKAATKPAQDKTNSNRAAQHDVNLRNPKKPIQNNGPTSSMRGAI